MSRMFRVLVMVMAFAASSFAADLVSMKLCSGKDCEAGTEVHGSAPAGVLHFLTAIKTEAEVEIYHVWIADGKRTGRPSVYDASTRTFHDADTSDLEWLKERKIEGAVAIVKLKAFASPRYRVRSQKTFSMGMAGQWKVQVYEATSTQALGELDFSIAPPDQKVID